MKQDFVARVFVIALAVLGICVGQLLVVPLIALITTLASLFIKDRIRYSDAKLVFDAGLSVSYRLRSALGCATRHPQRDVDLADWNCVVAGGVLSVDDFAGVFRDRGVVESHNGRELPIHFPAWGLGVLICLMHRSFIAVGPRLAMFGAAFVGVSLVAMFFQCNRFERVRRYRQRNALGQFGTLMVVLMVAGLVSWQGYEAWANSDNSVARWIIDQYHEKAIKTNEDLPIPGHLHAVNAERQLCPERVLLRGHSSVRPLYLRRDVFTQYDGTKWRRSNSRTTRHVTPLVAMANAPWQLKRSMLASSERAFVIGENPNRDVRPYSAVIIRGSQDGDAMLTLLGVSYASGMPQGKWLELDENGMFQRGFDVTEQYTYYLPQRSVERITPGHRNACLVLPRGSSAGDAQRIAVLARYITAECASTEDKIAAIETYLQDSYQLSAISPEFAEPTDRVPSSY